MVLPGRCSFRCPRRIDRRSPDGDSSPEEVLVDRQRRARRRPHGPRRSERLVDERRLLPLVLIFDSQTDTCARPELRASTHVPTRVSAITPSRATLHERIEAMVLEGSQSNESRRSAARIEVSIRDTRVHVARDPPPALSQRIGKAASNESKGIVDRSGRRAPASAFGNRHAADNITMSARLSCRRLRQQENNEQNAADRETSSEHVVKRRTFRTFVPLSV